jgi:hypothetical protein
MAKLSSLFNLLNAAILCFLITACQTVDNRSNKEEPSLYEQQQERESMLYGPKDRVSPLVTYTIDGGSSKVDAEPEAD